MLNGFFKRHHKLRKITFFFPLQLLFVVLKKNHVLVIFWLILFGIVGQLIAAKYGVPYLFLNPEYLNKEGIGAYFIMGFAVGGFVMAFNISTYIMNSFRFPFLATLSNPFFKFFLNNSIIPLAFTITYMICIYRFQINYQFTERWDVIRNLIAMALGIAGFISLSFLYFNRFNKDIFKMFGLQTTDDIDRKLAIRKLKTEKPIHLLKKDDRDWHVETYVSSFFSIRRARMYQHYKKEMRMKVFRQNHSNAAVFEVFVIITLVILGLFRDYPLFELPAGTSIILLFTLFLMLTSAIHSWLRGWSATVSILLLIGINYIFVITAFSLSNHAYGLNYKNKPAEYSYASLRKMDSRKDLYEADMRSTIEILNKWRIKNIQNSAERGEKPRLVLINTSGGGLRSALWTFYSLAYADSLLDGELMKHMQLITGSSGGMVGAAYLRELYLRQQRKEIPSIYSRKFIDDISKDILNPIAFSIATNDLFFRFRSFNDGNYKYTKDRGYAFESKLNENTGHILNKRLRNYFHPEAVAEIPMMVFAPVIINDGRKLVISSQQVSYLTQNAFTENISINPHIENIEFTRFFEDQDAQNLQFTSALRMNATFPYIMPVVSLPSNPEIEVMDAGLRDNYGLEITLNFLYTFRNWISSNTSGVVIIQVRGNGHKEFPFEENPPKTMMGNLSAPAGNLYKNMFFMQDFQQNQLLQYAGLWFDGKLDVIDFQLRNEKPDKISLSWHLTNREKRKILESIHLPENQEAIKRLRKLLE